VAVAGGAGAGDTGNGTAAAAVVVVVGVDSSVLEDASGAFGAVDARIGRDAVAAGLLLLLGVAIGPRSGSSQALVVCGIRIRISSARTPQGRCARASFRAR
jgi:hypothetical protein